MWKQSPGDIKQNTMYVVLQGVKTYGQIYERSNRIQTATMKESEENLLQESYREGSLRPLSSSLSALNKKN